MRKKPFISMATCTLLHRAVWYTWAGFVLIAVFLSSCTVPARRQLPVVEVDSTTVSDSVPSELKVKTRSASAAPKQIDSVPELSPASQLLIKACDNYLLVNPDNQKSVEVLTIKASLYFNTRLYDSARVVYRQILTKYDGTNYAFEAIRMIAQIFYEQRRYDEAQEWYKKLSEAIPDSIDKKEAFARIAESIFRMAEVFEAEGAYQKAAEQYERVALEYPKATIADVALFNAGNAYEKQAEWSHAILVFQRLLGKYEESRLLPKARFRIAKCHEKLLQWDLAAESYLRLTAKYPENELAPVALYNAGFSFENGEKFREAAATFEKMVQLFPRSEDAANVLFRAGELYGKVKDWGSVGRVTKIFSERFGNDEEHIVQALCMAGIALYMQNRNEEAVHQLDKAVQTMRRMRSPGTANEYYAAKALYTIAEIHHSAMNEIVLGQPRSGYKKQLSLKSDLLERAIDAYVGVIRFNISEWTTRAVFYIGQAYEDFAIGIFSQNRPADLSLEKRIAFELGIAQAVEKYFMDKAVTFHERNVKLGIKEKIEDKYILQSREKLTYLPALAAENYLALVEISRSSQQQESGEGFGLIARKLQMLQKIAPFQERAISLFLRTLELGTTYQEKNEFYLKASASITGISFSVGETYADVVAIARAAPIPEGFDDYERYVYKTKLLKQIEGYEDQALENYIKTIKIAEAYDINDQSVESAKVQIGKILFEKGRCYDLLCSNAFQQPPFPRGIDEAEKEEYRARFEEIGLRFQEQAFDIYRSVLDLAGQSYTRGEYVSYAYVRLYQEFPEEFGVKEEQVVQTQISSGGQWLVATDSVPEWFAPDFDDSGWSKGQRAVIDEKKINGFPGKVPVPMWFGKGNPSDTQSYTPYRTVYFRRTLTLEEVPDSAVLYTAVQGKNSLYFNGVFLGSDSSATFPDSARARDLMGKIRKGKNIIACGIVQPSSASAGFYPLLLLTGRGEFSLPKPPGHATPLTIEETRVDRYVFPVVKNFSLENMGEE